MLERSTQRHSSRGPGLASVAAAALAGFLVLMVILATQLRDNPAAAFGTAPRKPRIVVLRRIHKTVVEERVIAAPGRSAASTTSVSSSGGTAAASSPTIPPITTRTS